ncbi:9228_t:CDS:2 [Ambispora gerdemannii]|uniref:9228_t:CDS:1 n=1 Tax=Ambispora gerdemannii TaxID=144530 RepID=A0A9N9FVY1_9GLOM|nr:9228_t:CDS:2 [Ambispora gerdemannii]
MRERNNAGGSGSYDSNGITSRNDYNENIIDVADLDERIVLNVGGVKYETYRSTLTAYPDTLLGTMFAKRDKALFQQTNDNEYFIDRNGHAFYYILEFYRTGKVLWREHTHTSDTSSSPTSSSLSLTSPITTSIPPVIRQILAEEIHYFQLPIKSVYTSLPNRAAAAKVDSFIHALQFVIYHLTSEFAAQIQIDFRRNKHQPHVKIENHSSTKLYNCVHEIVRPYGAVGYKILEKFGTEIGSYLMGLVPELKWKLKHVDNYNWYSLVMCVEDGAFDFDGIRESTCLADSINVKTAPW